MAKGIKKANRAAQDDKEKTEKAAANAERERQKAEQQKAQQWQQRARAVATTMSQAELTAKINQLDSVLDDLDLGLYSLTLSLSKTLADQPRKIHRRTFGEKRLVASSWPHRYQPIGCEIT